MKTLGIMSTTQLENLIEQLETLPGSIVNRFDTSLNVCMHKKTGEKVKMLSAVMPSKNKWHVMCIDGLVSATR